MDNALSLDDQNTWELNIPTWLSSPPRNGRDRTAEEKKKTQMLKKLSEEISSESSSSVPYSAGGEAFQDNVHKEYSHSPSLASRTVHQRSSQSQLPTRSAITPGVSNGPDYAAVERTPFPVKFSREEIRELLERGPQGARTAVSSQVQQQQEQPTATKKADTVSIPHKVKGQSVFVSSDGKLYPWVALNPTPGTSAQMPIGTQPSMTLATTSSTRSPSIGFHPQSQQVVTMTSAASGLKRGGPVTFSIPPRTSGASSSSAVRLGRDNTITMEQSQQRFVESGEQVMSMLSSSRFAVTPASATPTPRKPTYVSKVVINNVPAEVMREVATKKRDALPTLAELCPGARIVGQMSHQAMEAHLKSMTGLMKAEAVKTSALPVMSSPGVEPAASAKAKRTAVPVGRSLPSTSAGCEAWKAEVQKAVGAMDVPKGIHSGRHNLSKTTSVPTNIKRAEQAEARFHPAVQRGSFLPEKPLATLTLGLVEGKSVVVVPDQEGATSMRADLDNGPNFSELLSRYGMGSRQERNSTSPMATVPEASPTASTSREADISLESPPAHVPDGPTPAPSPGFDQDFYGSHSEDIDALLKNKHIRALMNLGSTLVPRPSYDMDLVEEIFMDHSSRGPEPATSTFDPCGEVRKGGLQVVFPGGEAAGYDRHGFKVDENGATLCVFDLPWSSYHAPDSVNAPYFVFTDESGRTTRLDSEDESVNVGPCTISEESTAKRARNSLGDVELSNQFD